MSRWRLEAWGADLDDRNLDDLKWIGIDGELRLKKGHEIDIKNVRFHREMHQLKLS